MFDALSPWHLALILFAFVVLIGYKKLPDATRSLGRSVRIFKSEVSALRDEPAAGPPPAAATAADPAAAIPEPIALPAAEPDADELEAQARAAEARAALLRAQAEGRQTA